MIGRSGLNVLQILGRSASLAMSLFGVPNLRRAPLLFIKQLYAVGVLSLPIIVVSGLFIGMVLSCRAIRSLVDYGSEQAVGQMLALSLV